ncbi:MAG: Peptidoglycan-binding lysin domain protein [Peptococcaceae bacterium]|jgi:LysM repeat protein|nr:Peptidoglycan-binding lysin domain protein [Peptococcaceae bacterium]
MALNVTTRKLKVENVVGEAMRQVNVVRNITLPVLAKKIESVDTKIRNVKFKIIEDKIIVEATLHKQIYYVECITGDVQEFTVPDERITEFVHIEGARPGMDARVSVEVEYCDVEAVDMAGDQGCHRVFQQTCILKIKAKVIEMVEIDVVTNVSGEGVTPTFRTITIDNVIGSGCEQFTVSDSLIPLPANTKKIKSIDAEIRDVEKKVIPNKVVVKGTIHKQIFYVIEPSGEVKETSANVPFNVFVPIQGAKEGQTVITDIRIEFIDSELVTRNHEKFVKETIVLEVCAKVIDRVTINIVTAVAGAEVETRRIKVERIIGEGCRQVNILADIITPMPARKVARVDARLRDLQGEAIPDKVIVKGTLHKQIYYVSAVDDQLRELSVDEPFTEFVHVEGAEKGDMVDVTGRIEYVNVEAAANTPTTQWRQTAVLEICAKVTETEEITVVTAVKGAVTPPPPPAPPCPPGTTFDYVIQKGDTLTIIARKFNVTVQAILAVNPQITNPNLIFAGRTIKIPCPPGMG